jgi:hypothetical protein
MKKHAFIFFFISISFSISAQSIAFSFLNKHEKDDNLEVVSIGKKMLEKMSRLTSEDSDLQNAIKGLENICIVSSKDTVLNREYYNSAQNLLSKSKGFESLFSMNTKDEELVIMIKESKGYIKELVVLSDQPDGFNLISITGNINLDVLINYSEVLNIQKLNGLRSIKNNH